LVLDKVADVVAHFPITELFCEVLGAVIPCTTLAIKRQESSDQRVNMKATTMRSNFVSAEPKIRNSSIFFSDPAQTSRTSGVREKISRSHGM